MARIPIFDSEATQGNMEQSVDNGLAQDTWVTSRPVRLTGGPGGDQRNVSYEFILSGENLSAWDFEFYQEFWGDCPYINIVGKNQTPPNMRQDAALGAFPNERIFPGSLVGYPWAREQIAIAGAAGRIDQYNVVRYVTMTVPALGQADCRWFPMLAHAYWTRLKIRTTSAAANPMPQLRVYAHVGGATDIAEYTERISTPFDWGIPE